MRRGTEWRPWWRPWVCFASNLSEQLDSPHILYRPGIRINITRWLNKPFLFLSNSKQSVCRSYLPKWSSNENHLVFLEVVPFVIACRMFPKITRKKEKVSSANYMTHSQNDRPCVAAGSRHYTSGLKNLVTHENRLLAPFLYYFTIFTLYIKTIPFYIFSNEHANTTPDTTINSDSWRR